jgi:hypothetical protein
MRLTLRTLLAWLDTVLPPPDQKNLGEKVAASPVAPQLIARIRDVVERPVLAAPRPEGRGLADDANSVAEYLDNTLASDQLAAFERVCIESDVHLAEVAACHGILAEIARDPLAVGPLDTASRRRLLGAIQHQLQEQAGVVANGPRAAAGSPAWPATSGGTDCDTVLGTAPVVRPPAAQRRRAPLAAWLSALIAIVLLVALGGLLGWSLGRDRGRKTAARAAEAPVKPAVVPAAGPPAPVAPHREPSVEPAPMPADAAPPRAPPAGEPAGPPPVEESAAPPPDDTPAAPVPTPDPLPAAPPEQPRVPQGDAMAIAAPAAPVEQPSAPPPPVGVRLDVGDGAGDQAGFVSGAALLLHKAAAEPPVHGLSGWAAFSQNAPLDSREDLIAPPYCRPEVSVGGVTIRLEPNTRAVIGRDADESPRLEVVFGRAVVRSSAARPRLGITAGGLVGVVTEGLRGPVGVEVTLDRDAGSDPATAPARVRSMVATTTAGIAWMQSRPDGSPVEQPLHGIPAQGLLEKGSRLAWDSRDPGAVAVQARRDPPEWLAGPPRPDRQEEEAARALAAKAAVEPLEKGLRELADDRRAENRVAAVATLALVGDYEELVAALSAESASSKLQDGQWTRLVDMTLPLALSRGANAAARLARAFESRGPAGKGAEAFALARGFDDQALAAGGDATLVAALDAPELVLRRLAIRGLVEIVEPAEADRARYRPDRSKELRRESVNWWRRQLDDGRIRRPAAR